MDLVDRTAIPRIHAAARHHRSVYVSCLFTGFRSWLAGFLHAPRAGVRAVPCA